MRTPYMLTPNGYTLRTGTVEAFARLRYGTRTDAPQRVAATLRALRNYRAEVEADQNVTPLVKNDLIGQAREAATETVKAIRDQWEKLHAEAMPPAARLIPDAGKDAAYHAAAARAWARTRAELEAGIGLEDVLAEISDPVTLEALREEYPAYARSRYPLDAHAGRVMAEAGESLIAERTLSLLPATAQATEATRSRLEGEANAFRVTVAQALYETGGGSPAPVIVNLKGEAIPV